ncbi:MAG TPA: DUF2231 domain-containing protein [Gammaproteobacteria bacterium]|nr:DUF2231 domain-containing protein [Gammaproteobacteria bacterium]
MHFHPLHPALVHFPIACWVLAVPCDIAGWLYMPQAWYAAYLLILGGVVLALPAMLAGMPDLAKLKNNKTVMAVAYRHIGLIGSAWILYLVSLMLRVGKGRTPAEAPGVAASACALIGLMLLLAGAWHGAELVYSYGIGIRRRRSLSSQPVSRQQPLESTTEKN